MDDSILALVGHFNLLYVTSDNQITSLVIRQQEVCSPVKQPISTDIKPTYKMHQLPFEILHGNWCIFK